MKTFRTLLGIAICLGSSMIGYQINVTAGSSCPFVWAVIDFFMWPLAWFKWLVCQQVNVTLVKQTFAALFN